jgi:hypothetical protein
MPRWRNARCASEGVVLLLCANFDREAGLFAEPTDDHLGNCRHAEPTRNEAGSKRPLRSG